MYLKYVVESIPLMIYYFSSFLVELLDKFRELFL